MGDLMSYHFDTRVNDIMLTVINDGNGDQCGADYAERCRLGKDGTQRSRMQFRYIARECARRARKAAQTSLAQSSAAGDFLFKYYVNHAKELA